MEPTPAPPEVEGAGGLPRPCWVAAAVQLGWAGTFWVQEAAAVALQCSTPHTVVRGQLYRQARVHPAGPWLDTLQPAAQDRTQPSLYSHSCRCQSSESMRMELAHDGILRSHGRWNHGCYGLHQLLTRCWTRCCASSCLQCLLLASDVTHNIPACLLSCADKHNRVLGAARC
jgi:hypothetical protein